MLVVIVVHGGYIGGDACEKMAKIEMINWVLDTMVSRLE